MWHMTCLVQEELDHRVWELYGGADKEEHVYREWCLGIETKGTGGRY